MITKKAALTLLVMFSLIFISSCGVIIWNNPALTEETQTSSSPDSSSVPNETTAPSKESGNDIFSKAKEKLSSLPAGDFGGIAKLITCAGDSSYFTPEGDDSPVSASLLKRNAMVSEKLNTIVMTMVSDVSTMLASSKAAYLSGTYYTDLISVPLSYIGTFEKNGVLLNMNSLPYVDFSSDYYSQQGIKQLTYGYYTYGAVGDATEFYDNLVCVFVNNNLCKKLDISPPFEDVYSGDWTWDRFYELIKSSSSVYGVYGFGYDIDKTLYSSSLFASCDRGYSLPDESGVYSIDYIKSGSAAVEKLRGMYENTYRYYKDDGNALGSFYAGKMLFYIAPMSKMAWFYDMPDDWSILPLPKADSSQEKYTTLCDLNSPVISVLESNNNTSDTGLFLEALFASSYGYFTDAYVEMTIMKYARNNDSLNMIYYVGENIAYDFAFAFGNDYPAIANATYGTVKKALTENKELSDVFNIYKNNLNKIWNSFKLG